MLQIAYKTQQFQFVGEITPQFVMQILKCVSKRAAVVLSIFNQLILTLNGDFLKYFDYGYKSGRIQFFVQKYIPI